jgi:hypothetical protein
MLLRNLGPILVRADSTQVHNVEQLLMSKNASLLSISMDVMVWCACRP